MVKGNLKAVNIALRSTLVLQEFTNEDMALLKLIGVLLEDAQKGKVSAMYEVGRLFERGRGTAKSLESAISWYEKAPTDS